MRKAFYEQFKKDIPIKGEIGQIRPTSFDGRDWNKPKSLAKHERVLTRPGYSEWFPIYAYNFSEHPNVNTFKDVIQFNPDDKAPEQTYHLGLNSWCVYDNGEYKSKEIPTFANDDCELKRTIVKANGEFETQCLD